MHAVSSFVGRANNEDSRSLHSRVSCCWRFRARGRKERQLPARQCARLSDKIKAETSTPRPHFVALTPGQFHFAAGIYVGNPGTPEGMPPGDGAILITRDGSKDGTIVWTRGKNACAPIKVPEPIMKLLNAIKTGVGESADDDSKDELKL